MSDKVVVFDVVEVQDITGARPRSIGAAGTAAVRAIEVGSSVVKDSFQVFLASVQDMLAQVPQTGDYEVETVEVHAQISAEGKVGFLGAGLAAAGAAGLKVILQRRKITPA